MFAKGFSLRLSSQNLNHELLDFQTSFLLLPSFLLRFLLEVTLRTVGCAGTSELIMNSPCQGDVQDRNPAMETVMCVCRASQWALSFLRATITFAYTQCSPVCVNTHTAHICFFLLFCLRHGKTEASGALHKLYTLQFIAPSSEGSWLLGKMGVQLQQRGHRPGQLS